MDERAGEKPAMQTSALQIHANTLCPVTLATLQAATTLPATPRREDSLRSGGGPHQGGHSQAIPAGHCGCPVGEARHHAASARDQVGRRDKGATRWWQAWHSVLRVCCCLCMVHTPCTWPAYHLGCSTLYVCRQHRPPDQPCCSLHGMLVRVYCCLCTVHTQRAHPVHAAHLRCTDML